MKKYIVTLTEEERGILGEFTSKGEHKSQKILDALTYLGAMRESSRKNVRLTKKYPAY